MPAEDNKYMVGGYTSHGNKKTHQSYLVGFLVRRHSVPAFRQQQFS